MSRTSKSIFVVKARGKVSAPIRRRYRSTRRALSFGRAAAMVPLRVSGWNQNWERWRPTSGHAGNGSDMSIRSEWVDLDVADGTTTRAWVARPENGPPSRGLLVFQEAFGVNAHIRDVTERFAALDFVAIAPELFHRTAPRFEGKYTDL